MMIQDIAEYLEDHSIGTVGTDMFVGYMPDAPAACIALYEYAGRPPDRAHDGNKVTRPGLQVVVRGAVNGEFSTIRAILQNIEDHLDGLVNATIEGTFYRSIYATQSIAPLGRENLMHKAAQSYYVDKG